MKTLFPLLICLLFFSTFAQSPDKETRLSHYNLKKNIGIGGYDPVSYFENSGPVKGKKEIRASFKGIIYLFANEENKNKFLKGALKYEPQYGGWCAYAMGEKGEKVGIDPETFKITDGKLYLFYNKFGYNTLTDWNKNEKDLTTKADDFWKNTLSE